MKNSIIIVVINAEKCGGRYISLSLSVLQPSSYLRDVHPTKIVCSHVAVVMYSRNIWIVNKKMSAKSDRNMLAIAAPSRMTTCTTGVGELSCTGTRSSKQPSRSKSTSLHQILPLRVLCCTTLPGTG